MLQTRCQEVVDAKVAAAEVAAKVHPCCWPSCEFPCLPRRSWRHLCNQVSALMRVILRKWQPATLPAG